MMLGLSGVKRQFQAAIDAAKDKGGAFCEKNCDKEYLQFGAFLVSGALLAPAAYQLCVIDNRPLEDKKIVQADASHVEAKSALERLAQRKQDYLQQNIQLVAAQAKGDQKEIAAVVEARKAADAAIEQEKRTFFSKLFLDPSISEKEALALVKDYKATADFGWTLRTTKTEKKPAANIDISNRSRQTLTSDALAFRSECMAENPVRPERDLILNISKVSDCMELEEKHQDSMQFFGGLVGVLGGLWGAGKLGAGFRKGLKKGASSSYRRREEKVRLKKEQPSRFGNN